MTKKEKKVEKKEVKLQKFFFPTIDYSVKAETKEEALKKAEKYKQALQPKKKD